MRTESTFFARLLKLLAFASTLWSFCAVSQTVSVTPLITFNAVNNGDHPYAGLAWGSDGNLYGSTEYGGISNSGTIFVMSRSGKLISQTSFTGSNGGHPLGSLILGGDGNLYGTAYDGGSYNRGTLFRVGTNGAITSLASFAGTNGANPWGSLARGNNGSFYGTTEYGGTYSNGTIFQATRNGALTPLVSFAGPNGQYPVAGLVLASDGNFYGTTVSGGSNNLGTVFRVTSSGALTSLTSFNNTNGANPWGWLTLGSDGNFYGTTANGGTNTSFAFGTVFRVSTEGVLTSVFSFTYTNGANPYAGLTSDAYGNLYGITSDGGANSGPGTIFMIATNGMMTTVFNFSFLDNGDGGTAFGGLLFEQNTGNFYGTAWQGGLYGHGTVFLLAFPIIIRAASVSNGNINLSFQTTGGQSYTIQQATGLGNTNWVDYTNFVGTGALFQVAVPTTNFSAHFFRVRTP